MNESLEIPTNTIVSKDQMRQQIQKQFSPRINFVEHKLSANHPDLTNINITNRDDLKAILDGLYNAIDAPEIQYCDQNGQPLDDTNPKELEENIHEIEGVILEMYKEEPSASILVANVLGENRLGKNRLTKIHLAIQMLSQMLQLKELSTLTSTIPMIENYNSTRTTFKKHLAEEYEYAALKTLEILSQKYPKKDSTLPEPLPQP